MRSVSNRAFVNTISAFLSLVSGQYIGRAGQNRQVEVVVAQIPLVVADVHAVVVRHVAAVVVGLPHYLQLAGAGVADDLHEQAVEPRVPHLACERLF